MFCIFLCFQCGDFLVPDTWCGLSKTQVQKVCDELFGKEADYVDWRHFLVCAAQPWPLPLTHQLLETGKRLRDSANGEKMISRQQFMAVQTWMDEKETEEEGEGGRGGFSRNEKLKPFFFQLFSEKDRKVDYTKMLLYLSVDSSAELGLAKALSAVTGEHISLNQHDVQELRSVRISLDNFHRVLTQGHPKRAGPDSDSAYISKEAVGEVFDRVGHGEGVEEVDMKKLLMDPVAVEWLDSLTCYTLPDLQAVLRARSAGNTAD
jgi:hypothetical protein